MKIKIISDGTPNGTLVVDADTGEKVDNIYSIKWELLVTDGMADVELGILMVPVELVGKVKKEIDQ